MNVATGPRRGRGVTEATLTDGTLALDARRISLGPGERRPPARAEAGETFLYVIAGTGSVSGVPLAVESVVWLEPGDEYSLAAGDDGLDLLLAHA